MLSRLRRRAAASPLPYDMFDLAREAYDARTADTLGNVYHRGHERAWSGKEVLAMLLEKHGQPQLSPQQVRAIQRVFAIILWGELGAWKISAQLADRLVPLEARMAATGQAFDEARHFYTMHDYLALLGPVPERIDPSSEKVLDLTLRADGLAHKVCGMQLMIETIALTLFRTVRESGVEPVLCDLLRYYEIDEARHVALGVNYMPFLIKDMNPLQRAELLAFQFRIMTSTIRSLWNIRAELRVLGIDPRVMLHRGKAKQFEVFRETWAGAGIDLTAERQPMDRFFDAIEELFFPDDDTRPVPERLRQATRRAFAANTDYDPAFIEETRAETRDDATLLEGMASAGQRYWSRRQDAREKNGTARKHAAAD